MSDLSKVVVTTRSDVVPGFILSKPALEEHGMAEEEFCRAYLAVSAAATVGLPDKIASIVIDKATAKVAAGEFNFGTEGFDASAFSSRHSSTMLWLCLREKQAKTTREEAAEILSKSDKRGTIMREVLTLWGYNFKREAAGTTDPNVGAGLSSGPQSSASSEPKDSTTPPSNV